MKDDTKIICIKVTIKKFLITAIKITIDQTNIFKKWEILCPKTIYKYKFI